ncbi:MAG: PA domain-containing protein [Thermoanaerobaculia bacterium]
MRKALVLSLLLLFAAVGATAGTGKFIIVNTDAPNDGLNDPTPVAPVGGNNGTTLGQQRMNVFQAAADRWATMLDTNVDIRINASFTSIPGCTDTSAVLGQAAPMMWVRDFKNAPLPGTYYPIALANSLANEDLSNADDIFVQFNSAVDNDTCLGESNWYYGLDGNNGIHSDLFVVVLHELAHGLGVAGGATAPGFLNSRPAITDVHTLDLKLGLRWDQMSSEQRRVSLTNTTNLVWDGPLVKANVGRFLQPVTTLTITEPQAAAKNYDIGLAAFGPAPNRSGMSGRLIRVTDESNPDGTSTNDGCTALTNADAVRGNIAFIDRGSCTFVMKARNAQAAGATGVVIGDRAESYTADNPPTCLPPGMAGEAADVTIPVISVGISDANLLKTNLPTSNVAGLLRNDPSQLAGTSKEGYMRLYAPCTNDPGSSLHHWDTVATPNLLMEPSVNSDLLLGVDLTIYQLLDIGWKLPPRTGRRILKK